MADESGKAPAGSAGRKRRRHGGHSTPATPMRFRADVREALEREARETERPKVAIVEGMLIDRYELPA